MDLTHLRHLDQAREQAITHWAAEHRRSGLGVEIVKWTNGLPILARGQLGADRVFVCHVFVHNCVSNSRGNLVPAP